MLDNQYVGVENYVGGVLEDKGDIFRRVYEEEGYSWLEGRRTIYVYEDIPKKIEVDWGFGKVIGLMESCGGFENKVEDFGGFKRYVRIRIGGWTKESKEMRLFLKKYFKGLGLEVEVWYGGDSIEYLLVKNGVYGDFIRGVLEDKEAWYKEDAEYMKGYEKGKEYRKVI